MSHPHPRGLKGRDKLWPLVPSVEDDIKATVEATLKAGWDRAMVVADPNSLEATLSTTFVDHYKASGGLVESYESLRFSRLIQGIINGLPASART